MLEVGIAADRLELGECFEISRKVFARALINDFLGKRQSVIADLRQAIAIADEHEARSLYTGLFRAYLAGELAASGDRLGADTSHILFRP